MANNRIDVYLHDQVGSGANQNGAIQNENITPARAMQRNSNPTASKNIMATKGMVVASTIASGAFNYITSNVGEYTGNSQAQTQVNNAMELGQTAAMFFVNPTLAMVNVGLKLGTTAIDENIRKRKESVGLAQAQARAGYPNGYVANYRKR